METQFGPDPVLKFVLAENKGTTAPGIVVFMYTETVCE
jgi:hypothetical protein